MIVESSSGMSSLCSPSPSPPSPAIEKENPFREAMMKFAAMEQVEDKKIQKKPKVLCTKSTETAVPTRYLYYLTWFQCYQTFKVRNFRKINKLCRSH